MSKQPQPLVFVESPEFTIATNTFINVPVILQYDDEPLIEMVHRVDAGYTSRFRIFNDSGDLLAAVESTQIHRSEAGKKSGLSVRNLDKQTVCELDGQTLFQIERVAATALKASAELYAPDGRFIIAHTDSPVGLSDQGRALQIRGLTLSDSTIKNCRVGIGIESDGSMFIGRA